MRKRSIRMERNAEQPFWPRRNWWLALLAILVLAGALRLPGYDFSLPYVEKVGPTEEVSADEVYFSLAAKMILDSGTAKDLHYHNYPPGILAIHYLALRLFHDTTTPPSTSLAGLRLLSVFVSLATMVAIALLAYTLAGELAGLLGAFLWSITPAMVQYSRFTTPEIYLILFTTLSIWLAFSGARHSRHHYTAASVYALMLAILFKYSALLVAPFVLFAPLIADPRSYKSKDIRRVLFGNLFRFALFSAWLIFLTPVLEAFNTPQEDYEVVNAWIKHVRIDNLNWDEIFAPIAIALKVVPALPLLPGWLGLVLLIRRPLRERRIAISLAALVCLWLLVLGWFNQPAFRFMIPAVTLAITLAGVGYAQWWQLLVRRYGQRRVGAWATLGLGALLLLNSPNLRDNLANIQDLIRPDRRNDLANWADTALPAGQFISTSSLLRTLNREWGGYAGKTPFHYAGSVFSATTVAEWRAQGVDFAILPYDQYWLWREDEDGDHDFVRETVLLKSYPPDSRFRDPAMVVLRLQPIQHSASGQLGPIHLVGYDLDNPSPAAEQTLRLHLYWQAQATTDADYQVFNHLLDDSGHIVAQSDGQPLSDPLLRRGTSAWDDPEEMLYSREFAFPLPADLNPGQYTLITGFYHRQDGQRLRGPNGEDSLQVAQIHID